MLRITTNESPQVVTMRLEGRLEGPWVEVLAQSFGNTLTKLGGRRLCVDLNGVTFVDAQGKAQLAEMYAKGSELLGEDIETKALVGEIRSDRSGDGNCPSRQTGHEAVGNGTERLNQLRRLQAELHAVNEELAQAARPLERLADMNIEQRNKVADQIRAKLVRWESVTREIQQVMGTSTANGENESESK